MGHWVQVERKAMELWGDLTARKPRAGQLLLVLVARMGDRNAVGISQKTIAKLMRCSVDTVQRAVRDLTEENYIQVVRMNGPGTVAAYVINDRVAWGQPREELRLSVFTATLIADAADQPQTVIDDTRPLKKLPRMFPGERQLPTGDGLPPPSEPTLPGMEPALPALQESTDRQPGEEAQSIGSIAGTLLDRLS
ncbi:helix-turn-helix domain-containing protein [Sphingomonas sp. PAMC 26605]|uniref:helix-turn-helix domain-containing protein n=1 Tax=Sphingomonas sp. PAMC 26605 TaxID=1112214 RepID=UPI00026CDE84|nr:helix-turn-helix domain-containing protein [Sphingomonas sp. PAMC 26605]